MIDAGALWKKQFSRRVQQNTMPSRKKSKGQARKAKAAQVAQRQQLACCSHGFDEPGSDGTWIKNFLVGYQDLTHKNCSEYGEFNWYDGTKARLWYESIQTMFSEHPKIWESKKHRGLLRMSLVHTGLNVLIEKGVGVLEDDAFDAVCCFAVVILFLERYNASKCVQEIRLFSPCNMKERDAIEGCLPSLVRFFSRRVPCKCLHKLSLDLKSKQRTGICQYCSQRMDRRNLFVCVGCHSAEQYCSLSCQVADWPRHRISCSNICHEVQPREKEY